jgi:hypothetical protein
MTLMGAAAIDLMVGVASGLIAGQAMNLFQSLWMEVAGDPEPDETAASKAADVVSEEISGAPVKATKKKTADSVVHYLTAGIIGGAYGLLGGKFPRLFTGQGMLFGIAVWLVADELAVPALRLGPPPARTKAKDHALCLGSHLVFGIVMDLVRRRLNAVISSRMTAS